MEQYTLDLPYPPINELDVNLEYGQIILSNLGGLYSEMNAVSLYLYNQIILEQAWPKLSEAMQAIGVVEMHHLHLFGQMACRLGVDPRLWDCENDFLEYWSPGYNVYPRQINSLLENAIIQEKKTVQIYHHQIECIADETIQNILKRIILDEEHHIRIFEYFLNEYQKHVKYTKSSVR